MGLSVGSFAEGEACSLIKSKVRQWQAGALRRLSASRHWAGVSACSRPWHGNAGQVFAMLKRAALLPNEQLEVGAKIELRSLHATEHNRHLFYSIVLFTLVLTRQDTRTRQ